LWYLGTVKSGPFQFDDEAETTARWEVAFDDGDPEFLHMDELQCCCIAHRPPCWDNPTPAVETVAEDDDDPPCSSPMVDPPLDQRPEILFPYKDEDLPPHLPNHVPTERPILRRHLCGLDSRPDLTGWVWPSVPARKCLVRASQK